MVYRKLQRCKRALLYDLSSFTVNFMRSRRSWCRWKTKRAIVDKKMVEKWLPKGSQTWPVPDLKIFLDFNYLKPIQISRTQYSCISQSSPEKQKKFNKAKTYMACLRKGKISEQVKWAKRRLMGNKSSDLAGGTIMWLL